MPQSFKVEVIADSSGRWNSNGVRVLTREEAERYARNLESRWTAVREWRVVESDEPVTDVVDEYGRNFAVRTV